jgi:hypothetical protein
MAGGARKPHNRCTNALTTARDQKSFALHISAQIIGLRRLMTEPRTEVT